MAVSHSGPTLTVDLAAVGDNVRAFRAIGGVPLLAVVKADGFGHGLVRVARTALAAGASYLGVTTLDEAVALRVAGIAAPVLSWLNAPDTDWDTAIRLSIDIAVPSVAHLRQICDAAIRSGRRARIHLYIDTGLNRDGAPAAEWPELVADACFAERERLIEVVGMMSHFACADTPGHPANARAVASFRDAVTLAEAAGLTNRIRHLAATVATQAIPDSRFDLVRVGAGLFGIGGGVRSALTLTAPVVLTRYVARGTAVGYGHADLTSGATTLALIPVGYADGIPYRLEPGASVQLSGRRRPIIGVVSMDQIVVDAGPAGARVGDVATVFGPGRHGEPTLSDWAVWARTLPQDIVTRIGPRIAREIVEAAR